MVKEFLEDLAKYTTVEMDQAGVDAAAEVIHNFELSQSDCAHIFRAMLKAALKE